MAKPSPTELEIRQVGEVQTTPKGNSFVECVTDVGVVAFWGDANNMTNIEVVKHAQPPFKATCGCIPSNWKQHALWVPQSATVMLRVAGD